MDAIGFDRLARRLGAETPRRAVLRLLAGSAGAGALGMFRAESAAADCRGRGGACTRDEQCCSRLCSGEGRCRCRREGAPCRFGGGRFDGACCSQRCRRDGTCA
jgi:hypothetical protein